MKTLALAVLLMVSLSGCAVTVVNVGGGNDFTYSANGNGNFTGDVVRDCAEAVQAALAKRPDLKDRGDEAFINCIADQGVRSI